MPPLDGGAPPEGVGAAAIQRQRLGEGSRGVVVATSIGADLADANPQPGVGRLAGDVEQLGGDLLSRVFGHPQDLVDLAARILAQRDQQRRQGARRLGGEHAGHLAQELGAYGRVGLVLDAREQRLGVEIVDRGPALLGQRGGELVQELRAGRDRRVLGVPTLRHLPHEQMRPLRRRIGGKQAVEQTHLVRLATEKQQCPLAVEPRHPLARRRRGHPDPTQGEHVGSVLQRAQRRDRQARDPLGVGRPSHDDGAASRPDPRQQVVNVHGRLRLA